VGVDSVVVTEETDVVLVLVVGSLELLLPQPAANTTSAEPPTMAARVLMCACMCISAQVMLLIRARLITALRV